MIRREVAIGPDYQVPDELPVFDWCMIYTDRHPGVASHYPNVAGQTERLLHLGAMPPLVSGPITATVAGQDFDVVMWEHYWIANKVYQELADDIHARRLEPKRRAYLEDRPGELDPTLCVLEAAPILAIAERGGDGGEVIRLLLAKARQPAAPVEPAEQATAEGQLVKKSQGRGGRRKGSGTIDDTAPIAEMLRLLALGEAKTVWDAAGKVAGSAPGQSFEAARRRISRKFRDQNGTDPPQEKTWSDIERELNSIQ
jgi:hypothetical protein